MPVSFWSPMVILAGGDVIVPGPRGHRRIGSEWFTHPTEPGNQVCVWGESPARRAARSTSAGVGLLPGPNPSANPVGGEEEGTPALATTEFGLRTTAPRSTRWCTRSVVVGAAVALSLSLAWSGSAMADPDNPATSDEAQQAWLDSSHRAGALNEEVLVAQESESAATAAAASA